MNSLAGLGLAFFVGAALGGLYLLILWHSVKLIARRPRHTLLFASSGLARIAAVLLGVYAVLELGDWSHALAAVTGFTVARGLVSVRMGRSGGLTAGRGRMT